jgi:hypothetical protein
MMKKEAKRCKVCKRILSGRGRPNKSMRCSKCSMDKYKLDKKKNEK